MTKHTNILLIDDDAQIRTALSALFDLQGWTAHSTSNVPEGLQLFQDIRPDLVIIDYHMPSISGLKGVEFLRSLNQTVPILVLTVEEDQAVADAFLEAGANDFVLKPVRGPDIIARINLHLRIIAQCEIIDGKIAEQGQNEVKGIVSTTQQIILDYLATQTEHCGLDIIAQGTGLAYQTVSRYLQHMSNVELVDVMTTYGKVGRPRLHYKLKPETK